MNEELKREALRYLAQQAEKGKIAWTRPAGVEPMPEEQEAAPAAPIETADDLRKSSPAAAPAAKPSATASGSPGKWPRGAPEPESTIPQPGTIEDPFPAYTSLETFDQAICNCQKCPLGKTRNKFVFGVGDPNADLVLVGEAPGADEDAQGEPFVGRAGKLLDQILAAVDLKRGEGVYICNILKCRPPKNRDPEPLEVENCEPHLVKQLQLLQPKLIVALGRIAAQTLLRTSKSLSKMRGEVHDYHGVPLLVTFHPAALLRNPQWKRPTWEDVQKMKKMLDDFRSQGE